MNRSRVHLATTTTAKIEDGKITNHQGMSLAPNVTICSFGFRNMKDMDITPLHASAGV
jgi:hypothetical protein